MQNDVAGPVDHGLSAVNSSQLSWKMLQALAATGVDVNQPPPPLQDAVSVLAGFMRQQGAQPVT